MEDAGIQCAPTTCVGRVGLDTGPKGSVDSSAGPDIGISIARAAKSSDSLLRGRDRGRKRNADQGHGPVCVSGRKGTPRSQERQYGLLFHRFISDFGVELQRGQETSRRLLFKVLLLTNPLYDIADNSTDSTAKNNHNYVLKKTSYCHRQYF